MAVGQLSEVWMMRKSGATKIVSEYGKAHSALNAIIMIAIEHGSALEHASYDKSVGEALRVLYDGVLKPILDQYPELTPELLLERGRKPR